MYLMGSRKPRKKNRTRSRGKRAALAAKNRRRVNRMARRKLGLRLTKRSGPKRKK